MKFIYFLMALVIAITCVGCNNATKSPTGVVKPSITETTKHETEATQPNEDTSENQIDENQDVVQPEIDFISVDELEYVNKELKIYGNVDKELAAELEKILKDYNKNISVAAYSLDGEKALVYNSNQTYFSACTIKMPIMLYCCKQIDEGKIDKDTILTYEERHYHGGSGSIRYNAFGSKYSIETLITLGLSISDNVAYEMIVEYLGHDGFNAMMKELGCTSTIVPNWSIWASKAQVNDFIKIWREVYEYFETGSVGAEILKNACTNTKFAYGVNALDVDYSHKSGDNFPPNAVHNDAGIIWTGNDYLFAIFTNSEGNSYDNKVIGNTAKKIYEIMNVR